MLLVCVCKRSTMRYVFVTIIGLKVELFVVVVQNFQIFSDMKKK